MSTSKIKPELSDSLLFRLYKRGMIVSAAEISFALVRMPNRHAVCISFAIVPVCFAVAPANRMIFFSTHLRFWCASPGANTGPFAEKAEKSLTAFQLVIARIVNISTLENNGEALLDPDDVVGIRDDGQ